MRTQVDVPVVLQLAINGKNHFYINGFVLSLAWPRFKTEAWSKLERARPLLGLQPRDKTAILVDKTIQIFPVEFP